MSRPDAPFPGTTSKIHMGFNLPAALGYRFLVALSRPPMRPHPDAIMAPEAPPSVLLTHAREVTWPDRTGQRMAAAILAAGGGVLFAFETLADALACHKRLGSGV